MKSVARRILGPFWRRVRPYVRLRADIDAFAAAWHQHLPALVNAIASVGAISREQARIKREHEAAIAELRQEIERLRAEVAARTPPSQ